MSSKNAKASALIRVGVAILLIALICFGLGYLGRIGFFEKREALGIDKSLVSQQAEYEKDFKTDGATIENPKLILDPYHASPLTALVLFETKSEVAPKVTVPGPTGDFEFEFNKNTKHVLPIYALLADTTNKVKISFKQDGKDIEKVVEIKTAPLDKDVKLPTETPIYDAEKAGNQLYFFTPAAGAARVAAYDGKGNPRWYLTNRAAWDIDRLENGHLLLGTNRIVNPPYYTTGLYEMDLLGKIYNEWSLPGGYHHDYQEMPNGNLLVATNDFSETSDTVEDYVVELDRKSGDIVKRWNLKDILPTQNTGNEGYSSDDWFHDNAVWYDEKTNSITLSGRHKDAIVNIAYDDGKLNWIIGDKTGWPEEYHKYFFEKEGELEWQWAQHASMITPEGDVFVLDNGNNKSKIESERVPAERSYTRGVIYDIDTENMTIRQKWQYGKERGAEFYSPYISDVDYLAAGHYIVHSGGISSKEGKPSNIPAMPNRSDKMLSDTVELLNDEVIFEIKLPSNFYRMEKMMPYDESDKDGLKLGKAQRLGSLGETKFEKQEHKFISDAVEIDEGYDKHNIEIHNEEDRLSFKGTFKENSGVRVVLAQGRDVKYYKIRVNTMKHAAMCISIFNEEEVKDNKDLTVTRYINGEGLSGKYKLYVEIYDKLYDTGKTVEF